MPAPTRQHGSLDVATGVTTTFESGSTLALAAGSTISGATASASPKAAPTNDLESPDGSVHDLTRARAAAHGGWEALYGPDTRPPAYHEARARAERLALDDVAEDYPMEASAEQQAPVLYRCGCADCPGLPWSPSGSQPHPCGRAAPDEPELLGEAQVLAEQPEHAHLAALRLRAARLGSVGILTATERAEVDALRWATSVLESARPEAPLQGGRDGDPWTLFLWHDIEGAAPRHALRRGSALRASGRADAGRTVSSILDALRAEGATEVRVVLRDPATHTAPQGPERYVTGEELERCHEAAEALRDAAVSYAAALDVDDDERIAAVDKRLLDAARAWVAAQPAEGPEPGEHDGSEPADTPDGGLAALLG